MKLTDKGLLEDAVQGAINVMESQGTALIVVKGLWEKDQEAKS